MKKAIAACVACLAIGYGAGFLIGQRVQLVIPCEHSTLLTDGDLLAVAKLASNATLEEVATMKTALLEERATNGFTARQLDSALLVLQVERQRIK
jgi:hypothetical protein